jgi:hypothetical protein
MDPQLKCEIQTLVFEFGKKSKENKQKKIENITLSAYLGQFSPPGPTNRAAHTTQPKAPARLAKP